jgi:hypothetical protein
MIDKRTTDNGIPRLAGDRAMDRVQTSRLAHQLTVAAVRQSEKAMGGILAVPVATALAIGASVLYVAAFFERGFEIFESSVAEVGRHVGGEVDAMQGSGWQTGERPSSEARA